jgi:hypothetical protein
VLRRAGCSVRPTHRRVSLMCTRRRFRHAQTTMEVGGAISSPRGCQWREAELGRRLGVHEERSGTYLYSRGRSVASLWGHPDDQSTRGVGGNARRRAVAPAAIGARRAVRRRVWPRHLAPSQRPWTSCTGAHRRSAWTAGHSGTSACAPDAGTARTATRPTCHAPARRHARELGLHDQFDLPLFPSNFL